MFDCNCQVKFKSETLNKKNHRLLMWYQGSTAVHRNWKKYVLQIRPSKICSSLSNSVWLIFWFKKINFMLSHVYNFRSCTFWVSYFKLIKIWVFNPLTTSVCHLTTFLGTIPDFKALKHFYYLKFGREYNTK